jgi:hypothetical protein
MPTTKPIASPRNESGEGSGPHATSAAAITQRLDVAGQCDVRAFAIAGASLAAGLLA